MSPRANDATAEAFRVFRRLMIRTRLDPVAGCWLWVGECNEFGYGNASGFGEKQAHRTSYRLFVGEIPEGMCVCHRCDTPACLNPAHLAIATRQDNTLDATIKGRMQQKLTLEQVVEIRKLRGDGVRLADIAERFGVSKSLVSTIGCGRHVAGELAAHGLSNEGGRS
jgi:hypothetical protein